MTKLKAFTDGKLKVAKMTISPSDRVETLLEKVKMLVTSIFSFSHRVFQSPRASNIFQDRCARMTHEAKYGKVIF